MKIEHYVTDFCVSLNMFKAPRLKSVHFMQYFKCFAENKIAVFVTLNPVEKII